MTSTEDQPLAVSGAPAQARGQVRTAASRVHRSAPAAIPGGRSARPVAHLGNPLAPAAGRLRQRGRDTYWILTAGFVYRACGGLVAAVGLALDGHRRAAPDVVVVAVVLALLLGAVVVVGHQRVLIARPPAARTWLLFDAIVVVAANLWASAVLDGSLSEPFQVVFWPQVEGTVIIWYALVGPWGAAAVVAAGAVLVPLMIAANGHVPPERVPAVVTTQLMWLGLALLVTFVVRTLLATRSTVALDEGIDAGRELQRLHHLREVHDTVLQTLEAIAVYASADGIDAEQRMQAIREAARAEAGRLRAGLERVDAGRVDDPTADLGTCVERFRSRGLAVEFGVDGPGHDVVLPRATREALRDATTEALNNVLKHAGTQRAHVVLTLGKDDVSVVVADDGRGFDPAGTTEGFGLPHSIKRRLADVGGWARITSVPGGGTTVRLRVTREPVPAGASTGRHAL